MFRTNSHPHQYIERKTAAVRTETLLGDRMIRTIYSAVRENAPFLFGLLLTARSSAFFGYLNYDCPVRSRILNPLKMLNSLGISPNEIFGRVEDLTTYRKLFERKIRYWDFRPMDPDSACVVSPADARVLIGSFCETEDLFIKGKFFNYRELIGCDKPGWSAAFKEGDYAVFRLTPEKYHYNHAPVSGKVVDIYEINGTYYSCNPGAVVESVTPFSKNKRVLTVIDTDVENGTGVGLVAMVEIVALMIGRIIQCYSTEKYDSPEPFATGLFIKKGRPKSLFRPGSSTTVLIFQKNRVRFSDDLLDNMNRPDVQSCFSRGFGKPLAVLPKEKSLHGKWEGLNLTHYGLLCANAYTFAVVIFFILGASAKIPLPILCLLILMILALCMPASKIVAKIVEKKTGTLTMGGAVFIGILTSPWLVSFINLALGRVYLFTINITIFLSALCVAYAYASDLEGEKVIPVQIMTAGLYSVTALVGTWLFLTPILLLIFINLIRKIRRAKKAFAG